MTVDKVGDWTGALSDRFVFTWWRGASLEVIPSILRQASVFHGRSHGLRHPTITANSSCCRDLGGVLHYSIRIPLKTLLLCMEEVLLSHDLQAELARRGRERAQKLAGPVRRRTLWCAGAGCAQARSSIPRTQDWRC